jgi:hypothetical protein
MKPVTFVAIVSLTFLMGFQKGTPSPSYINPNLEKKYNTFADQIKTKPAQAISAIKARRKQQPGNAIDAYLLAAAYAKSGDWDNVSKEIKVGNTAPTCIHYVRSDSLNRVFKPFVSIRQMARDCSAAAPTLGFEKGLALLNDARQMATKIIYSEPRIFTVALVGIAVRSVVNRGFTNFYRDRNLLSKAKEARQVEAIDKEWFQKAKAELQPLLDENKLFDLLLEVGLTSAEIRYYTSETSERGRPLSKYGRRKIEALSRMLEARERKNLDRILTTLPK